jgi:CheY-like chemotaxis protein
MSTADMLEEVGLVVREAGSGAAALAEMAAGGIDLCIVDVGLPDMNGLDLAARIRGQAPEMPLIFATGHARLPEAESLANVVTLAKPYGDLQLREAIAGLLAGRDG